MCMEAIFTGLPVAANPRKCPVFVPCQVIPFDDGVLDGPREAGEAGMEPLHPGDNSGQTWKLSGTGTPVFNASADDLGQRILVICGNGCNEPLVRLPQFFTVAHGSSSNDASW